MRVVTAMAALIALAACGGERQDAGGVTAEESQKLNEAEEMLDASPDSLVASDDSHLGNGEVPSGAGGEAATNRN